MSRYKVKLSACDLTELTQQWRQAVSFGMDVIFRDTSVDIWVFKSEAKLCRVLTGSPGAFASCSVHVKKNLLILFPFSFPSFVTVFCLGQLLGLSLSMYGVQPWPFLMDRALRPTCVFDCVPHHCLVILLHKGRGRCVCKNCRTWMNWTYWNYNPWTKTTK